MAKKNTIRKMEINPEKLDGEERYMCKGYDNLKKTYGRYQRKEKIGNKKVKHWKFVKYSDSIADNDEFIPIFFKNRKGKEI